MSSWYSTDISYFTILEMQCRCGCRRSDMDLQFMLQLEAIRLVVGPMEIASGFRCSDHNARVSRSGMDGPHTTGRAADIRIHGARAYHLIEVAQGHRMTGLGIAQKGPRSGRFVHLDNLQMGETPGPRPWLWSY
ncbi:MAG: D-Ala-D-Ala carboxypeptidase family metallohydrolase [Alphaproteobacteria bacterium]